MGSLASQGGAVAVCATVGMAGLGTARAAPHAPGRAGPELYISGRLADYDDRPLEAKRASAEILAVASTSSGIARIEVAVDGKRRAVGIPAADPPAQPRRDSRSATSRTASGPGTTR